MKRGLSASVPVGLLALVFALAPATGRAETRLTVQVFTASERGFLVNSALVSGARDAILIDAQFTLADAHRLIATLAIGKTPTLEGQTMEIHGGLQGDAPNSSYVWIPSIKTAITGDIVYQGVHPWTAETNAAARQVWVKTLDELAALGATTVVAGHKDPKLKDDPSAIAETRAYLKAFDEALAASKSADELEAKLKGRFPTLALPIIAHFGAGAQFPAATAARK